MASYGWPQTRGNYVTVETVDGGPGVAGFAAVGGSWDSLATGRRSDGMNDGLDVGRWIRWIVAGLEQSSRAASRAAEQQQHESRISGKTSRLLTAVIGPSPSGPGRRSWPSMQVAFQI